jgi:PIN domain nuclease of toxin-antitoxin system
MLNLDTHMLVYLFTGEVSEPEYRLAVGTQLAISDIVFWELSKLQQRDRLEVEVNSLAFHAWLRNLTVFPITWEIARRSTQLDFSSDPADEIIAATSIVERIPLLTRDQRIRKSKMVPLALA